MSDERNGGRHNEFGQKIGFPVEGWDGAAAPARTAMIGKYCRVEPLDPAAHASPLFRAFEDDREGSNWTYLSYGPFASAADYRQWLENEAAGYDPLFYTIVDLATGEPAGVASYLRIAPAAGSIEVGHIHYAPRLSRTVAATETMYLMMRRVFDELGYRRYEWKTDALNTASRKAAERLGFTFEGIFRNAIVYKGRNRDTAWYSIIDTEWPAMRAGFERWLEPSNFDEGGKQRQRLGRFVDDIIGHGQ